MPHKEVIFAPFSSGSLEGLWGQWCISGSDTEETLAPYFEAMHGYHPAAWLLSEVSPTRKQARVERKGGGQM